MTGIWYAFKNTDRITNRKVLVPYMDCALNMDIPNIFKSNNFIDIGATGPRRKAFEKII